MVNVRLAADGESTPLRKIVEEAPHDARLIVYNVKKYFWPKGGLLASLLGRGKEAVRAVDGVSFFLRENETYGLVGESGCGKTTVGRMVSGLLEPSGGVVLYRPTRNVAQKLSELGCDVKALDGFVNVTSLSRPQLKLLRREFAMVFQDPYSAFDPRYTVRGILEEPLEVHGVPPERRMELIEAVMEEVKLQPVADFLGRYPHMLSGGQRQRLGVARALILNPSIVVADEPLSMLDVSIRAEILELMQEEKRRRRISYLFITHDLAVARYICDRIGVMYLGKIVEEGPANSVIERGSHPYTRALVAAVPTPNPENRFKVKELPIFGEVPSARNIPRGCRFHPRCPYAAEECRQKEPPFVEAEVGHAAACFFAGKI